MTRISLNPMGLRWESLRKANAALHSKRTVIPTIPTMVTTMPKSANAFHPFLGLLSH